MHIILWLIGYLCENDKCSTLWWYVCRYRQDAVRNPFHRPHPSSYPPSRPASMSPPQFLVKTVNKNWTENGKESKKRVFVPLDGSSPTQLGNLTVRNMQVTNVHSRTATTSRPSSTGVKSLPRHMRPCPKSRKVSQEEVYPLALSHNDGGLTLPLYPMVEGGVVPQMLHVVNPNSPSVPVSITPADHLLVEQPLSRDETLFTVPLANERARQEGLTIGTVFSAADLANKQLASSLGLEISPAKKDVSPQPNFLLQPESQPSSQRKSSINRSHLHISNLPLFSPHVSDKDVADVKLSHTDLTASKSVRFVPSPVPSPPPIKGSNTDTSNGWTVVRAADDDVVEVICIDDD